MPDTPRPIAFAVPGNLNRATGGTIYDRNVIEALRMAGRTVQHVALSGSYPDAPPQDEAETRAALAALPPDRPVIIDGLALGALTGETLDVLAAPLIAMVHHPLGLETGLSPERARALLEREAANLTRAAAVIVPSPHTGRILTADFGVPAQRITVALPGSAAPDPVRSPASPPVILSVGSLAARKGHDTLLDALDRIAGLDWQARIVGATLDEAYAAALRRQCTALGLDHRVTFCGPQDPAALTEHYRAATLFALATRYEGYGMVFAEAMLHGLPIVACETGAVPDTVPADAGFLVPPDAPEALAAAMRTLLTEPQVRAAMAQAATAHGAALPRWTDTARIFGKVIDGI